MRQTLSQKAHRNASTSTRAVRLQRIQFYGGGEVRIRWTRWLLLVSVSLFLLSADLGAAAQSQAGLIIQRSVEANKLDWDAEPEYKHFERDREDGKDRTYEISLIEGSPYQRLVAVNGKPLSPAEEVREEQRLRQVISRRQHHSPQRRAARIARYEKDRKRDHLLMEQLTEAFNFTLIGEQKLGPYEVYALRATPRPGYRPPNNETKVLTGMQGQLWIEKKSFQWVKIEAEVIRPVSIEGFLARVAPGTRFEFEKMPVSGDIWLPNNFAMIAHAKIMGFISHRTQEDDTYWDYVKAGATPTRTAEDSLKNKVGPSDRPK